jgi:hypothetical protein
MPFSCEKCHKVFPGQRDLDNHMNRKNPCISDENKQGDHICEFCNNAFTCARNLQRHYTRCVVRNNHSLLIQHCDKQKKLRLEQNEIINQMKSALDKIKTNNPELIVEEDLEDDEESEEPEKSISSKYEDLNMEKKGEYIYVIKEREFVKTKENVYKIGRTGKGYHQRMTQYPKNSVVMNIIKVPNSKKYEDEIKKIFKKKFIQRKDIGSEYFEANITSIRKELNKIVERLDVSYE